MIESSSLQSSISILLSGWREIERTGSICNSTAEALTIAHLARAMASQSSIDCAQFLVICRNEQHLAQINEGIRNFSANLITGVFPAWDCRPYDGLSPSALQQTRRASWLAGARDQQLVLTTANAFVQKIGVNTATEDNPDQLPRVFPRVFPGDLSRILPRILHRGDSLDLQEFIAFLNNIGFVRKALTDEPGVYSIRGGLLDLFPAELSHPVRLDLDGDTIAKIRCFDPFTQLSHGQLAEVAINPAKELVINAASIATANKRLRQLLGPAKIINHPIVEKLANFTSGWEGLEHLQPLFMDDMVPLPELLPKSKRIICTPGCYQLMLTRLEQIATSHLRSLGYAKDDPEAIILPPEQLYVNRETLQQLLTTCLWMDEHPLPPSKIAINLPFEPGHDFLPARQQGVIFPAIKQARSKLPATIPMVIFCNTPASAERLQGLLLDNGISESYLAAEYKTIPGKYQVIVIVAPITCGIRIIGSTGIEHWISCEEEIFGKRNYQKKSARAKSKRLNSILQLGDYIPGDILVDEEYGVGKLIGLEKITFDNAQHDCIKLEYAQNDKLYVPIESINRLSRYSFQLGEEESQVTLDRLSSRSWAEKKNKARKDLLASASELLTTAAERKLQTAPVMTIPEQFSQFVQACNFVETEDQLAAIDDVISDLQSGHPTERLVCGDAGFGKTEIALRASFIAALNGMQVLVLVPTTLLAQQQFGVYQKRFANWPITLAMLSRLIPAKEGKKIKQDFAKGKLDIIVGTHGLLANDLSMAQPGLIIIDEEQHFGVKQKEKIKKLANNSHILSITATPIPRTLQQALAGMQKISLISTPPIDRKVIRNFVCASDSTAIIDAIKRELSQQGQVFYVTPYIRDLDERLKFLQAALPAAKIAIAHGQMPGPALEQIFSKFQSGKLDILLSSAIVESGLDIANANTIIIHRADRFGIAQLYQLRGRVGRGSRRGWCYFTLAREQKLTSAARQRLDIIAKNSALVSSFALSAHDLDLRGSGNLLGEQQSGHIREIGIELYQKLFRETIAELSSNDASNDSVSAKITPKISIGMDIFIPEQFVPDPHLRMNLYRQTTMCSGLDELRNLQSEWTDRFGKLPLPAVNIFRALRLKIACINANVINLDIGMRGAVLTFYQQSPTCPDAVINLIKAMPQRAKLDRDQRLVVKGDWRDIERRYRSCLAILQRIGIPETPFTASSSAVSSSVSP